MTTNSINATNGNITKKMNVVEKKIEGIFKNFQCKEDFEAKLERIEAAERWLQQNSFKNQIIKWETDKWGEIPADFGRK